MLVEFFVALHFACFLEGSSSTHCKSWDQWPNLFGWPAARPLPLEMSWTSAMTWTQNELKQEAIKAQAQTLWNSLTFRKLAASSILSWMPSSNGRQHAPVCLKHHGSRHGTSWMFPTDVSKPFQTAFYILLYVQNHTSLTPLLRKFYWACLRYCKSLGWHLGKRLVSLWLHPNNSHLVDKVLELL